MVFPFAWRQNHMQEPMAPAQSFCRQIFFLLQIFGRTVAVFLSAPGRKRHNKKNVNFSGETPSSSQYAIRDFFHGSWGFIYGVAGIISSLQRPYPAHRRAALCRSIMIHLRLCHRHTSHTVYRLVPVIGESLIRSESIFSASALESWRPNPGLIRSDKTGSSSMSHYSVVNEPEGNNIPS